MGYHKVHIKKGTLGQISKIQEELDELKDAEDQGVKILMFCELADLYGSIELYCKGLGLTMDDLKKMSQLTKEAFESGHRK